MEQKPDKSTGNPQIKEKLLILIDALNKQEAELYGSLTEHNKFNLKEKNKYFYIDIGNTGVFMVEKATGNIYRIKAYSQVYKNKCCGNIETIKSEELFKLRWW